MLLPVAFLTLFFVLVLLLTKKLVCNGKHLKLLPPSPPKLPFVGNLHQLGSISQDSLHALSMKYGPLMLLHLGQIPALIVSSPEMAQEIMKNQDDVFASRPSTKASNLLLYGGKTVGIAPYGEYWKHARKLYTVHMLGASKVKSFKLVRQEEVCLALEKIRHAQRLSNSIDLSEVFSSFTLDILCRVVVSRNFSNRNLLRELIEEGTALLGEFNFKDYIPCLCILDIFLKFDSKIKVVSRKWDDLLEQVITEHLNRDEKNGDFLDILLSLELNKQTEFELTKEHTKAFLLDMFGAGSHTTFVTLEWVMAELVKDQKTMQKLQQQIRKVSSNKQIITEEDLKNITWLKAVIKETLRIHPPAPLLVPRESLQESQVKGYHIPKGTKILINAWTINRDPKFWPNPEEFLPERFMEDTGVDFRGNNFHLIPFGAGKRICPGINFAISNIELMIANMLLHFNWELPSGMTRDEFDMSHAPGLTVRRNEKLCLVPREMYSTL